MNAYSHVEFLRYALNIYSRTVENVIYIIGDNCALNKRIADDLNVPLIGSASHRFNLEMQKFCKPYEPLSEKIQNLMKKMTFLKNAAKLRRETNLKPITRNETRWSDICDGRAVQ